jgi:hypothetical protein
MTMADSLNPVQRAIALDSAQLHDGRGGPVGHRPGFVTNDATNHARQSAYDAYEDDLTNAWRGAVGANTKSVKDALPTMDEREAAYTTYDHELANRWRGQ